MKKYSILIAALLCGCGNGKSRIKSSNGVNWVSAMSNVMHKGELAGTISLDTIDKRHLYGIGPTEGLQGELMVLNGTSYVSTVESDSTMKVKVSNAKAPFFVFAHIDNWREVQLPDSVITMEDINSYLDNISKEMNTPFFFRLVGPVDYAQVHIVNLRKGARVESHNDAHKQTKRYAISAKNVELLGVYSKEHTGIFIHHDTHIHVHLITDDKTVMGHLENLVLRSGAQLYVQNR